MTGRQRMNFPLASMASRSSLDGRASRRDTGGEERPSAARRGNRASGVTSSSVRFRVCGRLKPRAGRPTNHQTLINAPTTVPNDLSPRRPQLTGHVGLQNLEGGFCIRNNWFIHYAYKRHIRRCLGTPPPSLVHIPQRILTRVPL